MISFKKAATLRGHEGAVYGLAPGSTVNELFSAGGDGWIVRWDLEAPELGKLIAKIPVGVFSLLYVPEAELILAGDQNGGVHWIFLGETVRVKGVAHHQKGVFGIKKIGAFIFTIGGDGVLAKWSIAEQRPLESLRLSAKSLRSVDFEPESGHIAVGASDGFIYLLDVRLNLIGKREAAHVHSVFALRYAPHYRRLWSGGRDAMLKIWDCEGARLELVSERPAHLYTVNDLAVDPGGRWMASGSRDRTIKIWDLESGELLKVINAARDGGHLNSVNRLYWSSYNDYLISASDDRTLSAWSPVIS